MSAVLLVAAGGFCGGLMRHLLVLWPGGLRGTFAANLLAVVVLGMSLGHGEVLALAAGVGFAGALSTWSTLAWEIGELLQGRRFRLAAGYTSATLIAGLAVAWLLVVL
ncbi:MAG: CrcB family protein [Corynebacterium sp.]|uniref:fluoride efflux transporter FluC n=1 Tax=Corynebacterium sp. TaxID=1720 RepID=UPI0026E0916F|nr:CrcB family protein [Corynebacterium sp.]MDO5671080.1 CrcB family protein [Corynebacterium sp.]